MQTQERFITTRKHLTRMFTGIVAGVILLVGLTFLTARYITETHRESQQFLHESQQIFHTIQTLKDISSYFGRGGPPDISGPERRGIPKFGHKGPNRISFFVIDADGTLLFENLLESPKFDDIDFPAQKLQTEDGQYMIRYETPSGESFIFYNSYRHDFAEYLRDILILLAVIVIFSGLLYTIGYYFVSRALRPVEQNLEDMSDFIHNAGHELKTPLAVMRGNLQVMQAEKEFDSKLLNTSISQIDQVNGLIEGLRELSEVGKLTHTDSLALANTLKKIVGELSPLAEHKNITLTNHAKGDFVLKANQEELTILLKNLLKNAIKYTTEGGTIELRLNKNILEIQDSGVGITPEEQEKIFERFYQAGNARSEDGFGIGLSLVKKIADANGWKIEVESELGKGSVFRVVF